nr:pyridoxal phosphate phosphatase PHOSPHO2-like [Ciona intestinalis]|eukprot:XP_026696512.1 pyridoxal phosphate phosphatase PHOSPHO2-like [Ciona intestinalis]
MSHKHLVIFDFDNTISEGNTDTVVMDMVTDEAEAAKLWSTEQTRNWTKLVNSFLNHLFENGVTVQEMAAELRKMQLVSGMVELLKFLGENPQKFKVVIMSDANSFYIETLLEEYGLENVVSEIFTNKALLEDNGRVCVIPCHSHDHEECPVNMCKGVLIREFIKRLKNEGEVFSSICYVGDGSNDFCASINLSSDDFVFPRAGFMLDKMIRKSRRTPSMNQVDAEVIVWQSGTEIMEKLKQMIF